MGVEDLAKLFVPFTPGAPIGNRPGGTGLGLSISHKLALAMDGRIDVSSLLGRGTTFTVSLRADGRQAATPTEESAFAHPPALMAARVEGVPIVLYIEDDEVNVLLMEAVFEAVALAHLRLVVAVTGDAGVHQASSSMPSLVLLDMQLPDMDGVKVLQALKRDSRTASIPVIALSGDAMPEQIGKAREAGCEDYWTKPFNLQSMVAALAGRFPATHRAAPGNG